MKQSISRDQIREITARVVHALLSEQMLSSSDQTTQTAVPASPECFYSPWTGQPLPAHPSLHQFNVSDAAEAATKPGGLHEFAAPQPCLLEKGKPCDHCSACRTLGF
jgi:hypothetical protein